MAAIRLIGKMPVFLFSRPDLFVRSHAAACRKAISYDLTMKDSSQLLGKVVKRENSMPELKKSFARDGTNMLQTCRSLTFDERQILY